MKALFQLFGMLAAAIATVTLYLVKTEGNGRPWLQDLLDTSFGWPLIAAFAGLTCVLFRIMVRTLRRAYE